MCLALCRKGALEEWALLARELAEGGVVLVGEGLARVDREAGLGEPSREVLGCALLAGACVCGALDHELLGRERGREVLGGGHEVVGARCRAARALGEAELLDLERTEVRAL